ncbi:putative DNA primase/helicase [Staphylococcus saprophyticus]|uniref:phage/plasmid primase, P4 family n=1 Tax=Staphylococcus saprophyticus TaxID=29385 RepID=UPI001248BB29|nr:phage/plasmid primase, P4 family [Staphylococcus saprophyticus]MDW3860655.1 phage/plasmid primase, P4 family [Staphylococcus saprophyticus]MDW3870394.1 phage/plasmid primase, P4 family [Staphylococcus saprophyticus]
MAITTLDKIIEVNEDEIPEELKQLDKWVLWRAEWIEKQQVYSKVPYSTDGYKASSTNVNTWLEFQDAISLSDEQYSGIGFVLSDDDNYICLDIDDAVNTDTGQLQTDLAIEMTELTYCELSPSGTGLHCFFKGTLPDNRKKKRTDLDIELYDTGRFMTVTGHTIGQSEICDDQETINNIVERYFKAEPKKQNTKIAKTSSSIFTDDEIVKMMTKKSKYKKLLAGEYEGIFESPSEAVQSLLRVLAFYTGRDKLQMERIFLAYNNLTDKWDEKRGNSTWGNNELDTAIVNQETIYEPNSRGTGQSLRYTISLIRNEELAFMKAEFEKAKENGEASGRAPQTIGTNRCAVLLNDVIKFVIFDLEENTKLAMYQSEKGIYTQNTAIIKRIISWLEPRHNEKKALEVIYHLTNMVDVVDKTNEPHLIPVNNGVFNRKTMKLESFTPNYVFTTKISTNYIDNPKAPVINGWSFDSWLEEVACSDREVFTLLWQVINDSLNGNYTRKKAIFLVGDGNNAKGTFQTLLTNLIGFDNVASLKVNEFDQEFKLGVLEGKTLVIGDDVPVGVNIEDSSNFNSVVTGDPVLVNIKNKQPYRTVFRTTVIQSTNGMPRFKNKTGGTNRRLLIVPFNADFNGTKENPDIKEKYLNNKEVLEYVLYKAINLDFGKFIVPKVSADMLEEYKQDNDPVYDFKVTEFDTWKIDKVPKSVVYYRYKVFCENSGYHALSERKFYKTFNQYLSKNWEEERARFYSVADMQKKVGYFEPTLVPNGELKRSYINNKLKVV